MLPEASRGVIRLRPELPVWRRWEPGPVGSTGGGTHISVLAGGASSSGAAGGGSPTGRLIPPCPSGRLLCSLFFSSFSGFLSPMLSRPVTKVVSCPEPCPSQLAFSCSSQPLLCPAHRPVTGRQQRGGVRNLGFGVRFTRFESLLARF